MQGKIENHSWNSEPEVGILIKSLIDVHSCKSVMEVGVFKGASYFSFASDKIGYIGIDIEDHREEIVKDKMEEMNHVFIKADSITQLKKFSLNSVYRRSFDLIFIDSVHEYDHCMAEFKECEKLISNGGLIVFHDSVLFAGVKKVIDYIKGFKHFDVLTLNTPDHEGRGGASGISIVRCNY